MALLGALSHYLRFKLIKAPVLLLELGDDYTQSFIVGPDGVDVSRPIASGVAAMIPVVQKELGLKKGDRVIFLLSFSGLVSATERIVQLTIPGCSS